LRREGTTQRRFCQNGIPSERLKEETLGNPRGGRLSCKSIHFRTEYDPSHKQGYWVTENYNYSGKRNRKGVTSKQAKTVGEKDWGKRLLRTYKTGVESSLRVPRPRSTNGEQNGSKKAFARKVIRKYWKTMPKNQSSRKKKSPAKCRNQVWGKMVARPPESKHNYKRNQNSLWATE